MEDTKVTFETAKLAKEKEFPQSRKAKGKFRYDGSIENLGIGGAMIDTCKEWYERPTQSLLAKWLRKEHGIYIELLIDGWSDDDCVTDDFLCYRCFIWQVGKPRPKHNEDLGAGEYEKIFEIGLQEALKLIKND